GGDPEWTQLQPTGEAPSRRAGHSAIYDPVRDRMLVFGGVDSSITYLADLWALSLSDPPAWSKLDPSGFAPNPRSSHAAIYDPRFDRMVVFGGQASGIALDTVWCLSLDAPRW